MEKIELGQLYEERAKELLLKKGYIIKEHSSKINKKSYYDFIVEKDGVEYLLEVKGRDKEENRFIISKRKFDALSMSKKPVLIMAINSNGDKIIPFEKINEHKFYFENGKTIFLNTSKSNTMIVNNIDEDIWRKFAGMCKIKNTLVGKRLTLLMQKDLDKEGIK